MIRSIDPRYDITSDVVDLLVDETKARLDDAVERDRAARDLRAIADSLGTHTHKSLDQFCEYLDACSPKEHARFKTAMRRILIPPNDFT